MSLELLISFGPEPSPPTTPHAATASATVTLDQDRFLDLLQYATKILVSSVRYLGRESDRVIALDDVITSMRHGGTTDAQVMRVVNEYESIRQGLGEAGSFVLPIVAFEHRWLRDTTRPTLDRIDPAQLADMERAAQALPANHPLRLMIQQWNSWQLALQRRQLPTSATASVRGDPRAPVDAEWSDADPMPPPTPQLPRTPLPPANTRGLLDVMDTLFAAPALAQRLLFELLHRLARKVGGGDDITTILALIFGLYLLRKLMKG